MQAKKTKLPSNDLLPKSFNPFRLRPVGVRRGYMGHITLLSLTLVDQCYSDPQLKKLLDGSLSFLNPLNPAQKMLDGRLTRRGPYHRPKREKTSRSVDSRRPLSRTRNTMKWMKSKPFLPSFLKNQSSL